MNDELLKTVNLIVDATIAMPDDVRLLNALATIVVCVDDERAHDAIIDVLKTRLPAPVNERLERLVEELHGDLIR